MEINWLVSQHHVRCKRWHNGKARPWSIAEWTNALAGEAGEACNASKKLLRLQMMIQNPDQRDVSPTELKYKQQILLELADTTHYAVLTADAMGMGGEFEQALVDTFNAKSIENGFPERL